MRALMQVINLLPFIGHVITRGSRSSKLERPLSQMHPMHPCSVQESCTLCQVIGEHSPNKATEEYRARAEFGGKAPKLSR